MPSRRGLREETGTAAAFRGCGHCHAIQCCTACLDKCRLVWYDVGKKCKALLGTTSKSAVPLFGATTTAFVRLLPCGSSCRADPWRTTLARSRGFASSRIPLVPTSAPIPRGGPQTRTSGTEPPRSNSRRHSPPFTPTEQRPICPAWCWRVDLLLLCRRKTCRSLGTSLARKPVSGEPASANVARRQTAWPGRSSANNSVLRAPNGERPRGIPMKGRVQPTSNPIPGEEPSPRRLTGLEWGTELWRSSPWLFDFNRRIEREQRKGGATPPVSGEIWKALPEESLVILYEARGSRSCPGVIRGGRWMPLDPPPPGPLFNKLVYDKISDRVDDYHFRPGILLGEPRRSAPEGPRPKAVEPHGSNLRSVAAAATPLLAKTSTGLPGNTLLSFGRAIFVPGFTDPRNQYGQLLVRSPERKGEGGKVGSYQFWQSWGVRAENGMDLLSRFEGVSHIRDCLPLRSEEVLEGEDAYDAARRLLAEAIGVSPLGARSPAVGELGASFSRGEVVQVTFESGTPTVPCVVVSTNQFNAQRRNAVVVLQCFAYEKGDEDDPQLIPLGPQGHLEGLPGEWTIDVALVRAIANSDKYVCRQGAPLRLDIVDPQRFGDLNERLEFFYA